MTVSRGIRKRHANTYELRRLVDAVRECLGLAPLYNEPYRSDEQRFGRSFVQAWQGFDADGGRRT